MYGEEEDREERQWVGIWETAIMGWLKCSASGRVAEVTAVEYMSLGASAGRCPGMLMGLGKPGQSSMLMLL